MKNQTKAFIAYLLIFAAVVAGVGYYWGGTAIIADSTPPVIDEAATTHGGIAYGTGKPTVQLFVTENLGLQAATAEIFNIGWLGVKGSLVQKCTMGQASKSGTTYKYIGAFTASLEANKEYIILYTVTDSAGNQDTYETKIKLVNLAGQVFVNGVEVKGPGDTIYVRSLDIEFKVVITQGLGAVDKIFCVIQEDNLDFKKSTNTEPTGTEYWTCTYKLPGDGKYEFVVIVKDTGSTNTQLASFSIELGTQYQLPLIIMVVGGLAAAAFYFYRKEEPKKERRSR